MRFPQVKKIKLESYDIAEDSSSESFEFDFDKLENKNKTSEKAENYSYVLFYELGDESERELSVCLIRRLSRRLSKDAKMKLKFCRSYFVSKDSDGTCRSKYLICFIGMSECDLKEWASIRRADIRLDPERAVEYGRQRKFPLAQQTFLRGRDKEANLLTGKWLPVKQWRNIYCDYSDNMSTRVLNIFEHRQIDPEISVFDVCEPCFIRNHYQTTTPFTYSERLRLSYEKIISPTNFIGAEIPIRGLTQRGDHPIVAIFPLHTENCKLWFVKNWLGCCNLQTLFKFPLDKIKDYFGLPIGFYFGFAQFYIRFLIPLSIFGVCYKFILIWKRVAFPSWFGEFMVLVIICWNVIFVEMYKRRESELRVRWGMGEVNPVMQRETFVGKWSSDEVTGELTQVPYKFVYIFRRFIGLTTLFVLVSIILATYAFIFWVRWMRTKVGDRVCADGNAETNGGCTQYRCVDSEDGPECGSPEDYVRQLNRSEQILLAIFNAIQILVYD